MSRVRRMKESMSWELETTGLGEGQEASYLRWPGGGPGRSQTGSTACRPPPPPGEGSTNQLGPGPAPPAQGQVLQGCSQVLPGPRATTLTGATVHQETGQPRVLPGSGVLDDPGPPCHHLQLPPSYDQLPGTPPIPPHLSPLPPLHLLQQGPGQSIFSPG